MTNPTIDKDGNKYWSNDDGELHCVDGPAVEQADGTNEWYLNGQHHRIDGPAVEYADGGKAWYQNGQRHRIDGPAIELSNGYKSWRINDQRHRIDGPAVEKADGTNEWWQYGVEINPNIKINHNICQSCKTKCHDEPKLINIPIGCKYELEHVVSNDD